MAASSASGSGSRDPVTATLNGTFGASVTIDPVKLAEWTRGPNGPTIRDLIERGERVKKEAQRLVGVYKPPDEYSRTHRNRKPGTLRDSIVKRIVDIGGIPAVIVGSEDPIALLHHEGTQAHVIRPRSVPTSGKGSRRKAAPLLVFYWPKVGQVVGFPSVNHPGTRPNRYLTGALPAGGGASQ